MNQYAYGTTERRSTPTGADPQTLELRLRGFCILSGVMSGSELTAARERLDRVYAQQELETGRDRLSHIHDADTARLPLAYDPWFVDLAAKTEVLSLVRELLGQYVVLHLQNGIINRPTEIHRQASWHRDLPYQEWTSSKPLAISALFCLDPFTLETGCTHVLPHSHRSDHLPPADYVTKHAIPVTAEAGSVICFDSMLFHRAGSNVSNQVRRGINHVYTIPLFKQQIDIPAALESANAAPRPELAQLLGYTSRSAVSVKAWREARP